MLISDNVVVKTIVDPGSGNEIMEISDEGMPAHGGLIQTTTSYSLGTVSTTPVKLGGFNSAFPTRVLTSDYTTNDEIVLPARIVGTDSQVFLVSANLIFTVGAGGNILYCDLYVSGVFGYRIVDKVSVSGTNSFYGSFLVSAPNSGGTLDLRASFSAGSSTLQTNKYTNFYAVRIS